MIRERKKQIVQIKCFLKK